MNRLISVLVLITLTSFTYASVGGQGAAVHTLVIDPGHGGMDPGAIGPGGHHESDLALAVSLKFGEMVRQAFPDVRIIYTRTTDKLVTLADRADMANKAKADLFICIHLNAANTRDAYGTSTYVLGLHRTDDNLEVAKRENAVIDLEGDKDKNYEFDPNSPEGHIIMSMKQNAFLDQSILIASKIEDELAVLSKRKSRGVKQAGFWVLYKTAMPSLLAEIGFISNPSEEQYLSSDEGQANIATSIFKAFRAYKFQIEGKKDTEVAVQPVAQKKDEPAVPDTAAFPRPSISQPGETAQAKTTESQSTNPPVQPVKPAVKIWQPDTMVIIESDKGHTAKKSEPPPTEFKPINQVAQITGDTQVVEKNGKVTISPVESQPKTEKKPVPLHDPNATSAKKPATTPAKTTQPKTKPADESVTAKVDTPKQVLTENPKPVASAEKPKTESKPAPKEPAKTVVPIAPKTAPKDVTSVASGIATQEMVIFTVQLIALAHKPSNYDELVNLFGIINREELSNGLVRYMAGQFTHYGEAKKALATAHDKGYKDAFIIAYENSLRTDSRRTQQLAIKNP